jgi:hypothetical protein
MDEFEQAFELFDVPTSKTKAKDLGAALTLSRGSKGWQLLSVTAIDGGSALLLAFQRTVEP